MKATESPHPPGEQGTRRSLEEVARFIADGQKDPEVRAWAMEQLFKRDNPQGCRGRAKALLDAVREELIWVPDPVGVEYMVRAGLLVGKEKKFWGGDCDDLTIALGSALSSIGCKTLVTGAGYEKEKRITHVLLAVWDPQSRKWLYADPSTKHPLGVADEPTRERILAVPSGRVVCDSDACLVDGGRSIDPDVTYPAGGGSFVGVAGPRAESLVIDSGDVRGLGQSDHGAVGELEAADRAHVGATMLVPAALRDIRLFGGDLPLEPQTCPFTREALQQLQDQLGVDQAWAYVTDMTGISPSDIPGGDVSWRAVAGYVSEKYIGLDITDSINGDGSINWRNLCGDIGGYEAAAFCAGTPGLQVAAPVCKIAGNFVGKALYDLGAAFVDSLGMNEPPFPPSASYSQKWAMVARTEQENYRNGRAPHWQRYVTMRQMAINTFSVLSRFQRSWANSLYEFKSPAAIEAILRGYGWEYPGALDRTGGPEIWYGSGGESRTAMWLAYNVIGADIRSTGFDQHLGSFTRDSGLAMVGMEARTVHWKYGSHFLGYPGLTPGSAGPYVEPISFGAEGPGDALAWFSQIDWGDDWQISNAIILWADAALAQAVANYSGSGKLLFADMCWSQVQETWSVTLHDSTRLMVREMMLRRAGKWNPSTESPRSESLLSSSQRTGLQLSRLSQFVIDDVALFSGAAPDGTTSSGTTSSTARSSDAWKWAVGAAALAGASWYGYRRFAQERPT